MTEADLGAYPSLLEAFVAQNRPDLSAWSPGRSFDAGDKAPVVRLERATAFCRQSLSLNDLAEPLHFLFSSADGHLGQAITELGGLGELARLGCLKASGWPIGEPGSARFDAALDIAGHELPLDVKPATNDGLTLLREKIEPIVEDWRKQRQHGPIYFSVDADWELTQTGVGDWERSGGPADVGAALASCPTMPKDPILIATAARKLRLKLMSASSSVVVNIMGSVPDERARLMAHVTERHVCRKAQKHGPHLRRAATGFLLCYTQMAGDGNADLAARHFCKTMQAAESLVVANCAADHELWLGAVHFDWSRSSTPGVPNRILFVRNGISWPSGLTAAAVEAALQASRC